MTRVAKTCITHQLWKINQKIVELLLQAIIFFIDKKSKFYRTPYKMLISRITRKDILEHK